MADLKDKAINSAKTVWCTSWTFTVNTGRRLKILGRKLLACRQQGKINCALQRLGEQVYQTLERGEQNPLVDPEVSAAVQRVKELKEVKEKNYQAIAAIRDRIRTSCVIATPDEPGAIEENPPVP